MFKYNELSDLVDGTLVTPLSKMDDGSVRCLDSNGQECFHVFKDFDFAKKIEERKLNSDNLESELQDLVKPEPEVKEPVIEEKPKEEITYQDMLDEMLKDDSLIDGSDEPGEVIVDPSSPIIETEGFCSDEELDAVLNMAGIKKNNRKKYNIWKDIL